MKVLSLWALQRSPRGELQYNTTEEEVHLPLYQSRDNALAAAFHTYRNLNLVPVEVVVVFKEERQ